MPLTRYVLFRSLGAPPSPTTTTRALSAIPHVTIVSSPPAYTVRDTATAFEVHVTLADGPLIAADTRALAAEHPSVDPGERALIAATDARFELRFPDSDAALDLVLLVQDALERLTGGFGYDFRFHRIVIAAEGEPRVLDEGPEQNAEVERLMNEVATKSIEEVERDLARAGVDVEATRREGAEFIAQVKRQRDIYDALVRALGGPAPGAREPRRALLAKLAEVRAEPGVGGALAWLLRQRGVATMSDGEVQAVVDEVGTWTGGKRN